MQRDVAEFLERREVFITDGDHSSRWKPSGAYPENEQTERKHEVRNYQECRGYYRKDSIRYAPESCGAPDSQGKSERPRHQSCDYREQQRVSGAHPQQRRNWTVVSKGVAHFSVQERIHPSHVAHGERPVKLVLGAHGGPCSRRILRVHAALI